MSPLKIDQRLHHRASKLQNFPVPISGLDPMLFGFSHECSNIMIDAIDGTQGLVLYSAILEFQNKDGHRHGKHLSLCPPPFKNGGWGGG